MTASCRSTGTLNMRSGAESASACLRSKPANVRRSPQRSVAAFWLPAVSGSDLVDRTAAFLPVQSRRMLCSAVSMTSSILPWRTCLARLRVKPFSVWAGTCEGRDRA